MTTNLPDTCEKCGAGFDHDADTEGHVGDDGSFCEPCWRKSEAKAASVAGLPDWICREIGGGHWAPKGGAS